MERLLNGTFKGLFLTKHFRVSVKIQKVAWKLMLLENDRFLDQTGNENAFQYFDRKSFWGFPKTGLEYLRIIFSTELQTLSEKSGSKNQIFYSFICWNISIDFEKGKK